MSHAVIASSFDKNLYREDLKDFIGRDGSHLRPVMSSDVKSFGKWKRANCRKTK